MNQADAERPENNPGTPGGTGTSSGHQSPPAPSEDVPGGDSPSQEELRQRIEEQLRTVSVQDLMVESVVSILNLTARRIAKEDERDLGQARVGIEAVRAWLELLPEDAATQVQQALSELQMLYAREVEGGGGAAAAEAEQGRRDRGTPGGEAGDDSAPPPPPHRGEPPPRLWTPGSS